MNEGHLETGLENFDRVRELVNEYCDVLGLATNERLKIHVWMSGSLDKASVHAQVVQYMVRPRVSLLSELLEVESRGVRLMHEHGVLPLVDSEGTEVSLLSLPDRILQHTQRDALDAIHRRRKVNGIPVNSIWQDSSVREGSLSRDFCTVEFARRLLDTDEAGICADLATASAETRRAREERVWLMLMGLTYNNPVPFMEKRAFSSVRY